ncbi:unnamed protein product [Oikopleura dioica]|uniref:Uncharacterized protein n=1 Tax=Oikopleura dioica TaxID=34765 RepID=E4XZB9_OIKDI|nr:unnamed protein product [Oikopleura dioica]
MEDNGNLIDLHEVPMEEEDLNFLFDEQVDEIPENGAENARPEQPAEIDLLEELDFGDQNDQDEPQQLVTIEQVRRKFEVERDTKVRKTFDDLEKGVRPGEIYEKLLDVPKFAKALARRDANVWAEDLRKLSQKLETYDRAIYVRDDRKELSSLCAPRAVLLRRLSSELAVHCLNAPDEISGLFIELEERVSILRSGGSGLRMIVSFVADEEVKRRYLELSNESNVRDAMEGELETIDRVARSAGIIHKMPPLPDNVDDLDAWKEFGRIVDEIRSESQRKTDDFKLKIGGIARWPIDTLVQYVVKYSDQSRLANLPRVDQGQSAMTIPTITLSGKIESYKILADGSIRKLTNDRLPTWCQDWKISTNGRQIGSFQKNGVMRGNGFIRRTNDRGTDRNRGRGGQHRAAPRGGARGGNRGKANHPYHR